MTFCLYGSENALNEDLNEILKENSLERRVFKGDDGEKKANKNKGKKKEEEVIKRI